MLTRRRMRTVCPPSIVKAFCGDFHIVLVLEFSFGELVFKSLYFILRFQFCCLSPLPQMVYLLFQRDQRTDLGPWTVDKARGQGALLNVSAEKTPTSTPPAASAPPINGKEDSPVLEMQNLRIPAVCLQGVIT